MKDKRYLHLGCGEVILPEPFENLDIRELPGVDHIAPVFPLSFIDNTFDLVYCSHVLEHFPRKEILDIVKDWVRVLKPGGILRLSVPSFEALSEIYNQSGKMENIIGPLMGGQTYKENFHYVAFDKETLSNIMEDAGLVAVHPWDYRRTEHSNFWDFSQAITQGISISNNLEGRKPVNESISKKKIMEELLFYVNSLYTINDMSKEKTYSDILFILSNVKKK